MSTVNGLLFNSRVPPSIEMDDVRSRGEIEPSAAGLDRQHEERDRFVFLEATDQIFAPFDLGFAVQDEPGPAENGRQEAS